MKKVLLIDGDIVAYQLSASSQRTYDLPEADEPVISVCPKEALQGIRDKIDGWAEQFDADEVIVCLSDDFSNYRKRVFPDYKGNRTGERPAILYDMKDAIADHYTVVRWPDLEADDVMGIMSTEPQGTEKRCIVSEDKDLATIPGWLWNPAKDKKPRRITEEDANKFFLKQVLTGDVTDGYPGCPGAGPALAEEVIEKGLYLEKRERVISRGPRKGQTVVEWLKHHSFDLPTWDRIVTVFESKGLTEEDALVQARCAFILRHTHYEDGRHRLITAEELRAL